MSIATWRRAGSPESADRRTPRNGGGNPVACAAALAVIDVLEAGALANAREVGELLRERMANTVEKLPIAGEVRGSGVMLGVELRHPDWVVDNDAITAATGWTPRVDLRKGLKELKISPR